MSKRSQTKKTNEDIIEDYEENTSFDSDTEPSPYELNAKWQVLNTFNDKLRDLTELLSKPELINPPNTPSTNIIDRMSGKSYNLPPMILTKFFSILENCRRRNITVMFTEKQNAESSGIMLDFDIYQDVDSSQITDFILSVLCMNIFEILKKILVFPTCKEVFYIGILRKPKVVFMQNYDCFKDGFHLLIPNIKISRNVKKILIKKLLEEGIIEKVFLEVIPTTKIINGKSFTRNDMLDPACVCVPVFLLGSKSKKDQKTPYIMSHIYTYTIDFSTNSSAVTLNNDIIENKQYNLVYEFSINFECRNGLIKKVHYEPNASIQDELENIMRVKDENIDERVENYGVLSTLSLHDAQINEIKEYLDALSPFRYEEFEPWRNVIFALASCAETYKPLALYFSQKSAKKFNMAKFENLWSTGRNYSRNSAGINKNGFSIGSIYVWAKQDNPSRYEELRKKGVYNMSITMIYSTYREGLLSHADIAEILYKVLRYKFFTGVPSGSHKKVWYEFILDDEVIVPKPGEIYKWRLWDDNFPPSLESYISHNLVRLFEKVMNDILQNIKNATDDTIKHYTKVSNNFKLTMRKLGDKTFIRNTIDLAMSKFYLHNECSLMDKDPLIRGIGNGIIKLGWHNRPPQLITGYHSYKISKYTEVPYIPFDPRDELTKKIIMTLRCMFPDNEPDSFEFMMMLLASTLDGLPKESLFTILIGKGAQGKSFLSEMHIAAIGQHYGKKGSTEFLTTKAKSSDSATPSIMLLKDSSFIYYSETNKDEVLVGSKIKEITGQETLSGRKLNHDIENFVPTCHHLLLSNNNVIIHDTSFGMWRRIIYLVLKIVFYPNENARDYDKTNPHHRIGDTSINKWKSDPEAQGRYYGFMVWMHWRLQMEYGGMVANVPHPHIEKETRTYEYSQNRFYEFLQSKLVKTPVNDINGEPILYLLTLESKKYASWHFSRFGEKIKDTAAIDDFKNHHKLSKSIKQTDRSGYVMIGYRCLDINEDKPLPGEEYFIEKIYDYDIDPSLINIEPETIEECWEKLCKKYDYYNQKFNSNTTNYDLDLDEIKYEIKYSSNNDSCLLLKQRESQPGNIQNKMTNEEYIKSINYSDLQEMVYFMGSEE